jgi:hypothetical protein
MSGSLGLVSLIGLWITAFSIIGDSLSIITGGVASVLVEVLVFNDWRRVGDGYIPVKVFISFAAVENFNDEFRFRWPAAPEGRDELELAVSSLGGGGSIR